MIIVNGKNQERDLGTPKLPINLGICSLPLTAAARKESMHQANINDTKNIDKFLINFIPLCITSCE